MVDLLRPIDAVNQQRDIRRGRQRKLSLDRLAVVVVGNVVPAVVHPERKPNLVAKGVLPAQPRMGERNTEPENEVARDVVVEIVVDGNYLLAEQRHEPAELKIDSAADR